MEQFWAVFSEAMAIVRPLVRAIPGWAVMALIALVAVVIGVAVGVRLSRRGATRDATPKPAKAGADEAKPTPENVALKSYQKILEDKGVAGKDLDAQMRDFARHFGDLRDKLKKLVLGDSTYAPIIDQARAALGEGAFGRAVGLLAQVGAKDAQTGFDIKRTADRHLTSAATLKVIAGDLELAQMNYAEAAELYREAIEALPRENESARAEYLNKHGTAAYQVGDLTTATASFEEALALLERTLGVDHPDVATALNNLALLYYTQGNYAAAEPLYRRSLAIDEKTLGAEHPGVATDLNNLALLYKKQGNLAAAEPLLKRALAIKEKAFAAGHPSLVTGLRNYAALLRGLGRIEEAEAFEARAAQLPPRRSEAAQ
jgi:tetratricopeptide (TPR) repeat protein